MLPRACPRVTLAAEGEQVILPSYKVNNSSATAT